MAEISVSLAIEKIASLIVNQLSLVTGVREEVTEMKRTLESIRECLVDVERSKELREAVGVRSWVKDTRDLAYDIEDIVDKFMLRSRFLKGLYQRYKLANEVQIIKKRLQRISDRRKEFSFESLGTQGRLQSSIVDSRLTQPLFVEESKIVGIDKKRQDMITLLLDGVRSLAVVSVVGMGGLGKTTLVRKVYQSTMVSKEFAVLAWITVSQTFSPREIMKSLAKEVTGNHDDSMDYCQLVDVVRNFLRDKRFLVVLDDLWTVGAWEDYLKCAFPENELKSRVIVTTRVHRVALYCSQTSDLVYRLEPLQADEARTLFSQKAFCGLACPSELEKPSEKILAMCGGLPLAIVAIGGLLLTENKSPNAWNRILNNITEHLIIDADIYTRIDRILSLSYDSLLNHLKPCLMYFCMFPQDEIIYRDDLIAMWIGEGFVKEEQDMALEETGRGYLNELVSRSLVEAASFDFDGVVLCCKVHDIIHELISKKSKEQNFITLAKDFDRVTGEQDQKVRRAAIYGSTDASFLKTTSYKEIRSWIVSGEGNPPNFAQFRMLKVLSLSDIMLGDHLPHGLVKLAHLRYLNLSGTGIKNIPNSIGKLKNLQTLDLVDTQVSKLPIGILKCRHLRVISCFSNISDHGFSFPARLGDLGSLVTLMRAKLDGTVEQARELGKLIRMRELGISTVRGQDWVTLKESLIGMQHLSCLLLNTAEEEKPLDISFMISLSPSLRNVVLVGALDILPQMFDSCKNLGRIILTNSRLRDDPLEALGLLPLLAQLILVQAYDGEEMCCGASSFPTLRSLSIERCGSVKYVRIEKGGMPKVEVLVIAHCPEMQNVPDGIENMRSLRKFLLYDMPSSFTTRIDSKVKGEDWEKVKHITLIKHEFSSGDRVFVDGFL